MTSGRREPPPLAATYRLQLNASFTLDDARAQVPYLHRLGVSHLYLSPVLAARAGSTHGYDVTDPTHVNRELGGEAALRELARTVHAHEMGIILDIVPNHMGVGPDNPYWEDVLRHGQGSRYARWFDVAWRAPTRRLRGKILLPVLGDPLPRVLERDELSVEVMEGEVRVRYADHHVPLDPATLPPELELAQRDPAAREHLAGWGRGEHGRARMRALLGRQHYELAFWRSAQRDLNYRRFFDVNELISLRVEDAEVFEATHRAVLGFVADGVVDGLRVDHIDGLLSPRRYLERLRTAVDVRRPAGNGGARFPIFVEKILASGERLPADWPVEGTTGYEILTSLEDVFIDPSGYAAIEGRYERRRGTGGFGAVARRAKRRVLRGALNADVRRIAPMLARVARRARWPARPIAAYAGAIVELITVLPVYRTYIDAERPEPSEADRAVLARALARLRETPGVDEEGVRALSESLIGQWPHTDAKLNELRLAFVLRWQQLTGPAAAKGVEDTALYVYAPLASRNEVGGDPGEPLELARERLEGRLRERAERWPRALNATNTHDTKRSADVRARLDALSEHADSWQEWLEGARRRHRRFRELVAGRPVPARLTDDFIYQSLVGIWPVGEEAQRIEGWRNDVRERLTAYIQKSVREAKTRTSWTDPDAAYESAIARFLTRLLDETENADFLAALQGLAVRLAAQGDTNSLARLVVHLTAPGTPDLYRGDELGFFALVDPDNRRPVDFARRAELLTRVGALSEDNAWGAQLSAWRRVHDLDALKLAVTTRLLQLRRRDAAAFAGSSFHLLAARGAHREHVLVYGRTWSGGRAVVIVPRLTRSLERSDGTLAWGDTEVDMEPGSRWRCVLTGEGVTTGSGVLPLSSLSGALPVSVLVAESES